MVLRLLNVAALVLVAVFVASSSAEERRDREAIRDVINPSQGLLDISVRLNVCVADPNGEELIPGRPRLRVLHWHVRGGVIDTSLHIPLYAGPPVEPLDWYCSEAAEEIVLHPRTLPPRMLVYGGMGASKTVTTAQWLWFRVLELIGTPGDLLLTVPTHDRGGAVQAEIMERWRPAWRTWRERRNWFLTPTRHKIRIVTTTQRSREQGSPVQGFNALAAAGEEHQDSTKVDGDIEMRGRSAPKRTGYRRLVNATAKDDPVWRTWKDKIEGLAKKAIPRWGIKRMDLFSSPFVTDEYRAELAETMDEREYQRKVLALDVPPEERTFHCWERDEGLRMIPHVGARDVTARELYERSGVENCSVLVGHDPGKICDTSELMRAYEFLHPVTNQWMPYPLWFVVGEVVTDRTTTDEHVSALLDYVRSKWGLHRGDGSGRMLVRIDPHTNGGSDDDQPDLTDLRTFQQRGIFIKPAAYITGTTKPARIKPDARIDLVNTLLRPAAHRIGTCALCKTREGKHQVGCVGKRRLFVACDDQRKAAAPKLVEALELCQRDAAGRAEPRRKDKYDRSHSPAAVGYGLWEIEKPRLDERRTG